MIIVSEPPAKAARRVSTGRVTRARNRSPAARRDIPGQPDARPIRVHTNLCSQGVSVPSDVPGIVLRRLAGIKGTYGVASAMAQAPPLTPWTRRRGRPGTRERGESRSSPPTIPPCQIRARCSGDQRSTAGTLIVTARRKPRPVIASQGPFVGWWRVKDSNLGRHQPTDLQSAPIGRSGNPPGGRVRRPCATIHRVMPA